MRLLIQGEQAADDVKDTLREGASEAERKAWELKHKGQRAANDAANTGKRAANDAANAAEDAKEEGKGIFGGLFYKV